MGNPGREYEETRHNYGFLLIDQLCRKWGVSLSKTTPHAVFEVVSRSQNKVVLVKPLTYMNRSGLALKELLRHFNASIEDLIVAHDDLDLSFGMVKMRRQGGPGSHNGVASIVEQLDSTAFGRIRFGIGPRPQNWSGVDYVLAPFEDDEVPVVKKILDRTAEATEILMARGFLFAMNTLNRKEMESRE
ncbi:MAG: aminoacyl-tRNA hydrolase [Candidatus Omnitrophica bacterium]|nr:aminoacyl-tRNA hydrolase [Candidatus Omnitrophota bacterium]